MVAPGRGRLRGANVPLVLTAPCEVAIQNSALPPPAHLRAEATLPKPRGNPLGGNWRQPRKSLEPEARQPWLRRATRGCGRLPSALGGERLAAKNERTAAAVCAKFWVARKGASRAAAKSRASCGQGWRATPGTPCRLPETGSSGSVAFAAPTPIASWGWVDAQPRNPSRFGGTSSSSSEAAGLRLAGQHRDFQLSPVVLAHFPAHSGFSVLSCSLLFPETRGAGSRGGGGGGGGGRVLSIVHYFILRALRAPVPHP